MKKTLFFLIMLALSISCKKPEPVAEPVETTCLIQKVSYDNGHYEIYKFDANNRLESVILTYDDNGKIAEAPFKYEYNAAGNLLKTKSDDGYIDEYIYDNNGLLTRVDFKDPEGKLAQQFTIAMDSQKRITKIDEKNDGIVATFEYNGPNGGFSKSETTWQGKILDQYILNEYETDTKKKSFQIAIKGHPFDPSYFTDQLIFSVPFNFGPKSSLATAGKSFTQYNEDWSDFSDKTRVYYDFKATRKFNSNNFSMETVINDAVSKSSFIATYSYSNCN